MYRTTIQFSKSLKKDELISLSNCKTNYTVKKGEPIFTEGENLKGIICIKDGVCKMTKLSANGNEQIVKLISKGELCV